jgi:aryl-alcohol dehydrogenase-like predicted oxidoreductase
MARYVAVSNWPAWLTARFQGVQAQMGAAPIIANQVYYSLLGRQVERELVPLAQQSGIGLVVYSPLAGGFLSGKYERNAVAPEGTRRATFSIAPRFDLDKGHDVVDHLRKLGEGYGVPPAHIALAWTMQRPTVAAVLFGISRASQLDENLGAADLILEDAHIAELDALTELAD